MNQDIFAALIDWNPWLEGEVPESLIGFPRQYDIQTLCQVPEIKILVGIRRAGKSTLLYQVVQYALKEKKRALYINFEDSVLRHYPLSVLYDAFTEKYKVDYLLIDEIQYCQDWVPCVRKLYDRKVLDQIWLTGSHSTFITKHYAELLTGRNLKMTVPLLDFSEYLRFKNMPHIGFPASKRHIAAIKQLFQSYFQYGAFPAVALRSVLHRELLTNYFEDFLYKDIAARYDVNAAKLHDLAIYLASNTAKLFSYRKIAAALNLHPHTVQDYTNYMKEIFLFDEIYRFDYSLKKQYSNEKKVYMIDTGLACSVAFRFSEDTGRLLETLVYQALKRQHHEIYFHYDKKECDFVIKTGLKISQAIQVTCSLRDPDTKQREIAGLLEAIQAYNLSSGLILTLDETDEITVERISILVRPVWQWLLC